MQRYHSVSSRQNQVRILALEVQAECALAGNLK
jgi:hypothetical protein